jgi:hypothetical protein
VGETPDSNSELAAFAAPVAGRLRSVPDEEDDHVLTAKTVPDPPSGLRTTALTAGGTYGSWHRGNVHYDYIRLGGERAGLRDLGILLLAAVLHERDVVLHLDGPEREDFGPHPLRHLRIAGVPADADAPCFGSLSLQARAYSYVANPERHHWPFRDSGLRDEDLPSIHWYADRASDPDGRYVIRASDEFEGFGAPAPSCRLAALLLDIGHPDDHDVLWELEGPPGVAGVAAGSAELQLMVSTEPWDWIDGANRAR